MFRKNCSLLALLLVFVFVVMSSIVNAAGRQGFAPMAGEISLSSDTAPSPVVKSKSPPKSMALPQKASVESVPVSSNVSFGARQGFAPMEGDSVIPATSEAAPAETPSAVAASDLPLELQDIPTSTTCYLYPWKNTVIVRVKNEGKQFWWFEGRMYKGEKKLIDTLYGKITFQFKIGPKGDWSAPANTDCKDGRDIKF